MDTIHSFPIEHIIVLMLENRSYDNLLGFLPGPGGLTGSEFNCIDPANPESEKVKVSSLADYVTPIDPAHDFDSVQVQLFGSANLGNQAEQMNGFVKNMTAAANGSLAAGRQIMQCFDPAKLPALVTLAKEFCLCTKWFAAVPGPTWPNRTYINSATSDGLVTNDVLHDYDQKTIFDSLNKKGVPWKVYYNDIPQSLLSQHHLDDLDKFKHFASYLDDLKNGSLPAYSFIEPRYLNLFEWKANDMHPPHDVRMGEYFIAEVYDALRSSLYWGKSLLVVLFDEHGGFYDHVPPPVGVPNPDGKVSAAPPFDFTRLGLRVPAILVSPWIAKDSRDDSVYEHCSLLATLKKVFGLPAFLTARDAAANTFEKNLSLEGPRTDAPLTLPTAGDAAAAATHRLLMRTDPAPRLRAGDVDPEEVSRLPLAAYQQDLVNLAQRLSSLTHAGKSTQPTNEHEAALQIHTILVNLFNR